MRFAVLGSLEVRADDGTPVAVAAPKRRALLAALLMQRGQPLSAARLIDALWGEDPPPTAAGSLHAHISRLRHEVGGDRIVTMPAGYAVRLREGELDCEAFERRSAAGRKGLLDGRMSEASAELWAALELWRGPAFADIRDTAFAVAEITRLDGLRTSALEDRIEADLALGRHGRLCAELESLVDHHPFREHLWYLLMVALYRSGRQADALAAYRRLRTRLVEDLGIDPSPELQELEIRILRQDPALAGPSSPPARGPVRLPTSRASVVGRRAELELAVALLASHRLLTITGPGGVGKTRLAVLAARAALDDYPDGVLFVDLAPVRDPAMILARLGEVVGGGERPAEVIGQRRMLLLLDNFEQVIDGATEVSMLLDECPGLTVLATSRAPLRIRGEQRLEVPPLDDTEGVELFEERAREAIASVEFPRGIVREIVSRLDGLPLAIELASARIGFLSPERLHERLSDRLAILTTGDRDAPDRHRTLRETIGWSYELLGTDARSAVRCLSVLAGDFDLAAAMAVASCDIDVIGGLVEQSLVRRIGDRYTMLETIREFAAAALEEDGETAAARDRHLAHFTAASWTARTAGADKDGRRSRQRAWLETCEADRENLHLAFEWAVAVGDLEATVTLFRAVGMYWLLIGSIDEGERWARAALDASAGMEPSVRTWVLAVASEFPRFSGDPRRSAALKVEALALARADGDESGVSVILDDLASVYASTGDFAKARSCLDESLAYHDGRTGDDPLDRAHTVAVFVELAVLERQSDEATAHIAELDRIEAGRDLIPDWRVQSDLLRARVLRLSGRETAAVEKLRLVIREAAAMTFRMPIADAIDELAIIDRCAVPARAARLFGMADRLRAEGRLAAWDPGRRDHAIRDIRLAMGDEAYLRLHSEGHALGMYAVIEAAVARA